MDGFSVGIDALTAAGRGIEDLLCKLDRNKVEDIAEANQAGRHRPHRLVLHP